MLAHDHQPPEPRSAETRPERVDQAAPATAASAATGSFAGTPQDRDDALGALLARAVAARAPSAGSARRVSPHASAGGAPDAIRDGPAAPRPPSRALRRKEVTATSAIRGPLDWTTADRVGNTARWRAACLANLHATDSRQYRRIVERRDFYKWFYEHTIALGYTTRWPLAASIVANGAHQVADMDEEHELANDVLGLAGVELQGVMREGNQVIFDNVLPKLKHLLDGGPLTGAAAMRWDMLVLAEEQTLVQPMYARMSREAFAEIDYIARQRRFAGWGAWWTNEGRVAGSPNVRAGNVPAFEGSSLASIGDRWTYGMRLGDRFTPGGTGFAPTTALPGVDASYTSGSEFARSDYRANLHYVDAWLNPNRLTRGPISNLVAALGRLSPREQQELLEDSSPDGWPYSTHLATWSPTVSEAIVRAALPRTPATRAAVDAFIARFRAEVARIEGAYATPAPYAFPL